MERKLVLSILAIVAMLIVAAILLPGGRPVDRVPKLPWKIALDASGDSSVFGLALGKSSLADARRIFGENGEVSMFARGDRRYAVEAFFERLFLSGLRADIVLSLDIGKDQARAMFDRGTRISQLGSGEKKVTLAPADLAAAARAPIRHITYLPAAELDAGLVESRFGTPARMVTDQAGIRHWLYPERGLDVSLDSKGKAVLQYVSPADFDLILLQPLERSATKAQE